MAARGPYDLLAGVNLIPRLHRLSGVRPRSRHWWPDINGAVFHLSLRQSVSFRQTLQGGGDERASLAPLSDQCARAANLTLFVEKPAPPAGGRYCPPRVHGGVGAGVAETDMLAKAQAARDNLPIAP